jgi:hypothetical protein
MSSKVVSIDSKKKKAAAPTAEVALDLFTPQVQLAIKQHIRALWERKKKSNDLNQVGLAAALNLNQSGVSRLLQRDDGYPWTMTHLMAASDYFGVSVKEMIPPEYRPALRHHFRAWTSSEEDHRGFLIECVTFAHEWFLREGYRLDRADRSEIGGWLAARLEGLDVGEDQLSRGLLKMCMESLIAKARER